MHRTSPTDSTAEGIIGLGPAEIDDAERAASIWHETAHDWPEEKWLPDPQPRRQQYFGSNQ